MSETLTVGSKCAAIKFNSLSKRDQQWIQQQLNDDEQSRLQTNLQDLQQLSIAKQWQPAIVNEALTTTTQPSPSADHEARKQPKAVNPFIRFNQEMICQMLIEKVSPPCAAALLSVAPKAWLSLAKPQNHTDDVRWQAIINLMPNEPLSYAVKMDLYATMVSLLDTVDKPASTDTANMPTLSC